VGIILHRFIRTLLGGLIQCTIGLGETHIRKVEDLVAEVFLPKVLYLVLVLVEEVILRKDLLLVVEDFCPKNLLWRRFSALSPS